MREQEFETQLCPFCKEEVKAEAVRCKHCHAAIAPRRPDHAGICPFCKEEIHLEAVRCSHCQADLASPARQLRRVPRRRVPRSQMMPPIAFIPRGTRLSQIGRAEPSDVQARAAGCAGCPDSDTDGAGTWCFIECSEHYCIYELCEPTPYPPFE
jgi:hypothetical protein